MRHATPFKHSYRATMRQRPKHVMIFIDVSLLCIARWLPVLVGGTANRLVDEGAPTMPRLGGLELCGQVKQRRLLAIACAEQHADRQAAL
jgi:hypothetical protein